MLLHLEKRTVPTEFEVRAQNDTLIIEGYALKWNTRSDNLGGFVEQIREGATAKTIQESDIRGLVNHNPNYVLGRTKSGTLKLSNDSVGTHYQIEADRRQSYVNDLAIAMERGDVNQSSFAFKVVGKRGQEWTKDPSGVPLRTLTEIRLLDVSPVTYPAYESATSGIGRSAIEQLAEQRGLPFEVVQENLMAVIDGTFEPGADVNARTTRSGLVIPDLGGDLALRLRLASLPPSR